MDRMIYNCPLWLHLLFAAVFLGMGYWFLESSRQRSSFSLDEMTYLAAEQRRLSRRFAGWLGMAMGLFTLFLLWFRKW